jgi:hypothetical protein
MLNRLVARIGLNGARIDAVIRQFVTAAMPQHVRMDFHVEAGSLRSPFDQVLGSPESKTAYPVRSQTQTAIVGLVAETF